MIEQSLIQQASFQPPVQESLTKAASAQTVFSQAATTRKPLGHYKVETVQNFAMINTADWPIEYLLAPHLYLATPVADLVEEAIQSHIDELEESISKPLLNKPDTPFTPDRVKLLAAYQGDIRQQIASLWRLGQQIDSAYQEITSQPFPDQTVAELVECEDFPAFNISTEHSRLPHKLTQNLVEKHVTPMPKRRPGVTRIFKGGKKHSAYRPAIDAHARRKIKLSTAPVLFGFFPPHIANRAAEKTGFMDGLESMNLLHGKRSHNNQIGNLLYEELLQSQKELELIVSEDVWADLLDKVLINQLDYYQSFCRSTRSLSGLAGGGGGSPVLLTQLYRRLAGNTPNTMHHLLVTGELSKGLERLHQDLPPAEQCDLLDLLGIQSSSFENNQQAIKDAIRYCRILETYTADSYFKNIDKICQALPDCQNEHDLNRIPENRAGHFYTTAQSKMAIQAKLQRKVGKNQILTVHLDRSKKNYLQKATADRVPNRHEGFISYQPDDHEGPKQVTLFERMPTPSRTHGCQIQ